MGLINEWGEDWLTLGRVELYARCSELLAGFPQPIQAGSFDVDSRPYLMATEHPWACLSQMNLGGRSVLCVAGSGDVPLFFDSVGADPVVAVDISTPACYLSEMKQAALRRFEWKEFLTFFLADLPRAAGFLGNLSAPDILSGAPRTALYDRVRPDLSLPAATYWDSMFAECESGKSPFEEFLRTVDLLCIGEIPYLKDEATYAEWRAGARGYALLNLPLDVALGTAGMSFDVVYASNVLEYVRMHCLAEETSRRYETYLGRFMDAVDRTLRPGGVLILYAFESKDSPTIGLTLSELRGASPPGRFELSLCGIEYSSSGPPGSRFRNTMITIRKN